MKFMVIAVWDMDKGAELAKVTEKMDAAPPSGYKPLARYFCLARPFARNVVPVFEIPIARSTRVEKRVRGVKE